jgi:hypothetical protein
LIPGESFQAHIDSAILGLTDRHRLRAFVGENGRGEFELWDVRGRIWGISAARETLGLAPKPEEALPEAQLRTTETPIPLEALREDQRRVLIANANPDDRGVRANTRTVIERKAAPGKAPGFLYLLAWPAPFMDGRRGRPCHGRPHGRLLHGSCEDGQPEHARAALAGSRSDQEAHDGVRYPRRRAERSRPRPAGVAAARQRQTVGVP